MLKLNQDKRIKGFLIYCDSGGGSSAAVEIMDNTISEIKKTKPVAKTASTATNVDNRDKLRDKEIEDLKKKVDALMAKLSERQPE